MEAYGFADKKLGNEVFEQFFKFIEREADDDRLYVKKAVNWALLNIGKRNIDLHKSAGRISQPYMTLLNPVQQNGLLKMHLVNLKNLASIFWIIPGIYTGQWRTT